MSYKLKDVVNIIRFNTSTTDDLSGNTVQPLLTNKSIVQQLNLILDIYSNKTKALEKRYSTQTYQNDNGIKAPSDILRSKGLRFMWVYNRGLKYPVIARDQNQIYGTFPIQNITGIPYWYEYFENKIELFPTNSISPSLSTLTASILPTDTTIYITPSTALTIRNGRVTIGTEKIEFRQYSAGVLTGCRRGIEDTIPAAHAQGDTVTENNVMIYYFGLHWKAEVGPDDSIDDVYANKDMIICDEHIKVITDYVTYLCLSKFDATRAAFYKTEFDKWLDDAEYDIQKGRTDDLQTDEIRDPFFFEGTQPLQYL